MSELGSQITISLSQFVPIEWQRPSKESPCQKSIKVLSSHITPTTVSQGAQVFSWPVPPITCSIPFLPGLSFKVVTKLCILRSSNLSFCLDIGQNLIMRKFYEYKHPPGALESQSSTVSQPPATTESQSWIVGVQYGLPNASEAHRLFELIGLQTTTFELQSLSSETQRFAELFSHASIQTLPSALWPSQALKLSVSHMASLSTGLSHGPVASVPPMIPIAFKPTSSKTVTKL